MRLADDTSDIDGRAFITRLIDQVCFTKIDEDNNEKSFLVKEPTEEGVYEKLIKSDP